MEAHSRVFGLDLMRAVAILLVLWGHGGVFLRDWVRTDLYELPEFCDGVTLFFVLSGFLIGSILVRTYCESGLSPRAIGSFWLRRWFRTLPNYFLVLAVLAAGSKVLSHHHEPFDWRYLVFSQNLASPHPAFFSEAWSLAVEEWFYLLLPLAVAGTALALPRARRRIVLGTVIAVGIVAPLVLRGVWALRLGPIDAETLARAFRKVVATRMDSIMFGVGAAVLKYYRGSLWRRYAGPAFALGVVGLLALKARLVLGAAAEPGLFDETLAFTAASLSSALLLPFLDRWESVDERIARPVRFVAVTSYAAYLLNYSFVLGGVMVVAARVAPRVFAVPGVAYVAFWALTLGLSWALYALYERRMTALRDRFGRRARTSEAGLLRAR
ncbi:MAG TPA: acyltransferase [Xanthobacteraceae bacterium]|nr:acyltransferase [Xanthobacteraceae bacterium]